MYFSGGIGVFSVLKGNRNNVLSTLWSWCQILQNAMRCISGFGAKNAKRQQLRHCGQSHSIYLVFLVTAGPTAPPILSPTALSMTPQCQQLRQLRQKCCHQWRHQWRHNANSVTDSAAAMALQILIAHLLIIFLEKNWLFCKGMSFSLEHLEGPYGSSGRVVPAHLPIFHYGESPKFEW